MENYRVQTRAAAFQSTEVSDRIEAIREGFTVELRRKKRQEYHKKRRFAAENSPKLARYIEDIDTYLTGALTSPSRLESLQELKAMLGKPLDFPLLSKCIDSLLFCLFDSEPAIQHEAAWVIFNLTASDHMQILELLNHHFIDKALERIENCSIPTADCLLWAFSNIAVDSVDCLELLVDKNILSSCLLTMEMAEGQLDTVGLWTVQCLVRENHLLPKKQLKLLFSFLEKFLEKGTESSQVLEICQVVTDKNQTAINNFLGTGLLAWIHTQISDCPLQCARIYGNLLAGDSKSTQTLLSANLLSYLSELLSSVHSEVRQEAYWGLSNLVATGPLPILQIIDEPILKKAFTGLQDEIAAVRREASWVFANISVVGSPYARLRLAELGILSHVVTALQLFISPEEFTKNLLKVCEGIVTSGADVTSWFVDSKCFELLESLQLPAAMTESLIGKIEAYFAEQEDFFEYTD